MIHQMRADARQVGDDRNVVSSKVFGWADTRKHEELERQQRRQLDANEVSCRDTDLRSVHGTGAA